ncbi:MAG: ATP-binding protein [Rhodobacteraceae bacterium]|nr:ATP-binding protein [Paracoccaceae bacterium]
MNAEIKHKTSEVYGISRELPLNYVSRESVDTNFIENLTRDKHVVIYGSSKQGKTSLRKHCLKEHEYVVVHCSNKWSLSDIHAAILKRVGYEVVQSATRTTTGRNKILASIKAGIFSIGAETEQSQGNSVTTKQLEIDPEDVNDIIAALHDFKKFIVLEDFHYLPVDVQKDFAVALKAFHEQSSLCFIIVGVWLEESRLTVYNGDLTGRVVGINADEWTDFELREVIEAGEALLNINFTDSFKNDLLERCLDSVYIVQESCYQVCVKNNVNFTQDNNVQLGQGIDVSEIVAEVVNQQTGRYNSFITQFVAGFQDTSLRMHKWLLYPVLTANFKTLENGLTYRFIRDTLSDHHPEKGSLNPGNLTQALQSTASLQVKKDIKPIVLDYDQTNLKLNVVDRGFLIWVSNQNKSELLELAGLPTD